MNDRFVRMFLEYIRKHGDNVDHEMADKALSELDMEALKSETLANSLSSEADQTAGESPGKVGEGVGNGKPPIFINNGNVALGAKAPRQEADGNGFRGDLERWKVAAELSGKDDTHGDDQSAKQAYASAMSVKDILRHGEEVAKAVTAELNKGSKV